MGKRETSQTPDRYGYLPSEGLVLTRAPGEKISVGNGLNVIEIVSVRGKKVKVRIQAPKGMRIIRTEIDLPIEPDAKPQAASA